MNNKTFNAKHLDPSFRVVSLRTTRTSLSLRCTRLHEFLPGSPFICALHGFELAQLWCQRLPQEGFIGRCACIIWLITYSIRQTCSECVNYAIKMTLRYYFHLSDWPVFRSFTIGYSWRGYQKKKKMVHSYKADVDTKWINTTEREFCNSYKKYIFIFPLQYPLKKLLAIHCQKTIKNM